MWILAVFSAFTAASDIALPYHSNKSSDLHHTPNSSNKRIAKVTKKGVIKALKKGKCKITVKTSDGKKKVIIEK